MVMERGDRDLFTVIMEADRADRTGRTGGRVEESLAREIIQQVLAGVAYIHGMHVCHRDLKPENIVLVEKPGTPKPVVKIIDFGSCAATAGGPTLLDLCGTPGFLPPEMIMEDSYDGFLGDVWSIGAIALEMVLGHELFSEIWLPAYAQELVGSRKAFAMQMADTVPRMRNAFGKRVKQKLASAASQEAICAALMVNPKKRIVVDNLFVHRWVGGKRERGAAAAAGPTAVAEAEPAETGRGGGDAGAKASSMAPASEKSGKNEGGDARTIVCAEVREGKRVAVGAKGEEEEGKSLGGGGGGRGGGEGYGDGRSDRGSPPTGQSSATADLPKISTLKLEGQGKQMRRSASVDDLKSAGGIARGLVNPERSPRRLPPLEGSAGSGGRGGGAEQTSGGTKPKLGVDTVLANKMRENHSALPLVEEPGSPAIGDAQRILSQGDAILQNWVREGRAGASKSGGGGDEEGGAGKSRARSPLGPKEER